MHLYNSLTRKKELFHPIHDREVKIYTCGPTIYHYVHIGNLRTFVFEDLLRRTLKYFDYKVTQVMNLTDVDDKTIKGAIRENVPLNTFTKKYREAFFEDLNTLNVEPAEHYPAATDYIAEMIQMIQKLMEKGMAYVGGDRSVYYPIEKFPQYGCLSHFKMDELKGGASNRVDSDEYEKDHVADFVLWKSYDEERDGMIYWESPFGRGRPGWHLECSAMAMSLLGETIDIHMGGVDNMFPHHENEIAQSEACSGRKFVNIWMHSEHLVVDGKKMSKSLGNFYTLRDLLNKGYSGIQVRYLLLQTHYKTQLNFTLIGLDAARESLKRLQDFIYRLKNIKEGSSNQEVLELINRSEKAFAHGLSDDLNISYSLAALFELVREGNFLMDQKKIDERGAKAVITLLQKFNRVLGILDFNEGDEIPKEVQQLFDERLIAKQAKDWVLSDALRVKIGEKGYVIEDSPQGARLKKL